MKLARWMAVRDKPRIGEWDAFAENEVTCEINNARRELLNCKPDEETAITIYLRSAFSPPAGEENGQSVLIQYIMYRQRRLRHVIGNQPPRRRFIR